MTRLELLQLLVGQARANGFEFRRWYMMRLGLPWKTPADAVSTLVEQRRYYALLFSHEFAASFWKAGRQITFQVPAQTFTRKMADGKIGVVQRKGYVRRSARENAWLYHLREMAASEDPLRYMRRYLRVVEDVDTEPTPNLPENEAEAEAESDFRVDAPTGSPESGGDDAGHVASESDAIVVHSKARVPRG